MSILFVALCIIGSVFQSVLCKIFGQKYQGDPRLTPMVYSLFMGILISFATFALNRFVFAPSLQTVALGCTNAILSYIYNYALLQATGSGPYSFVMLMILFGNIILPTGVSAVAFSEFPTVYAYLGIVVMLVAMVLMNGGKISLKGNPVRFYVFSIMLFFINGGYATVQKIQSHMLDGAERAEMIIITYGGQALVSLLLLLSLEKKQALPALRCGKPAFLTVILCSLCTTTAMNLYFVLVASLPIAVVTSVICGGTLLGSLTVALLLFKEKPMKVQAVGMVFAVAAMLLLTVS